jgi:hypothetical protein
MPRLDAITLWESTDATRDDERRSNMTARVLDPDSEPIIEVRATVRRYKSSDLPSDPEGWTGVVTSHDDTTWPQDPRATGLEVTEFRRSSGYAKVILATGSPLFTP